MLLGPSTSWTGVDDDSFDVVLADEGHSVSAQVFLDGPGAPVDFTADQDSPEGPQITRPLAVRNRTGSRGRMTGTASASGGRR